MPATPHNGLSLSSRTRQRRISALIFALAVILLAGGAWLVYRTLQAAHQEELLRHRIVAERLFDELERELTSLVDEEESRSFLEYRHIYVPEGQIPGKMGLARSPLADVPDNPAIVGYFQIDPDGRLNTPLQPQTLATNTAGEKQSNKGGPLEAVEQTVRELVSTVDWSQSKKGAATQERAFNTKENQASQQQQAPTQLQRQEGLLQSLNRALRSRDERQVQSQRANEMNVDNFRNELDPDSLQQETKHTFMADKDAAGSDLVDVELTPLQGLTLDDWIVLVRRVQIGAQTYRQGLLLDRAALITRLEQQVLVASGLAPWISLHWDKTPAVARTFAFAHTFAAPFTDLTVSASLDRIPGETTAGRASLLALAGLLALTTLLGGLALQRMVATELEFAERRSNFVAAVSHELKTPLTAIRMYAEMLRDGLVPSEERRQQYYETITAESERLSRLIANVLELARLERGTRALNLAVGPLEPVLRQVPEVLAPQLQQQGFQLDLCIAADLPAVSMDPDALLQILLNLVDNALKFAVDAPDRRITLLAHAELGGVGLVVRDHGPGVPPRHLKRLFQPFYRGERELTRRTKGTGMGLALVQGLVQLMGGHVRALNLPQGGFEVHIWLPEATGDYRTTPHSTHSPAASPRPRPAG